mgnify:FL=1
MTLLKKFILNNHSILTFGIFLLLIIGGCADAVQVEFAENIKTFGFLHGLLHGLIAPISFVISLFDESVAMYAINNNGGWYNFGFLLGASVSIGGGCKASNKKR